jgi:hypothetical protein
MPASIGFQYSSQLTNTGQDGTWGPPDSLLEETGFEPLVPLEKGEALLRAD